MAVLSIECATWASALIGLDPIDEDRYFFFDLERGTFTLLLVVKSHHRIPVLRVETAVGGKE